MPQSTNANNSQVNSPSRPVFIKINSIKHHLDYNGLSSGHKSIDQLNRLINKYNTKPDMCLLQQMHSLAESINKNLGPDSPSWETTWPVDKPKARSDFRRWYQQNPIRQALALSGTLPTVTSENTEMLFLKANQSTKGMSLEKWEKKTKNRTRNKPRAKEYQKMDALIDSSENGQYLHLRTLQEKVINQLNDDAIWNKPNMLRRMKSLLQSTNARLHHLVEPNSASKKVEPNSALKKVEPNSALEEFYSKEKNNDVLNLSLMADENGTLTTLANQLAYAKDPYLLGDVALTYLGGNNNKVWMATNDKTGAINTIRLEFADAPDQDYGLNHTVKTNPTTSRHLAKDSEYYPTNPINLNEGPRILNIAVSEYCPQGDLLNCRTKLQGKEQICDEVLKMTDDVAQIIEDLKELDIAYPDIKASNFLKNAQGKVITADIKSLKSIDENGEFDNNISTTYMAPGRNEDWMHNAEKFAVYQLSLMLYELALGPRKDLEDNKWKNEHYHAELPFDDEIFKTSKGQLIREVIEKGTQKSPDKRIDLKTFREECNTILASENTSEKTNELESAVSMTV